ncbi:MAG: glycosyltransferase family 4 protein, partial [Bryobacteraceae bacterium]
LSPAGSPCYAQAAGLGLPVEALGISAILRHSRSVDLVHAHDARTHTLAAIVSRAPLVVSRRVAFPIGDNFASRLKYEQPARYLAVSGFVRDLLARAGVPPEKISLVPDGVPLLDPAVPGDELVVLDKQTGLAPAAARSVARLPGDLNGAAIFLYLTHSEGLGSGVLVAMSAGVPVIASDTGGLPEIVRHEHTGILTANHSGAIAGAIRRLRDNPAFARSLAQSARRMVEQQFSVDRMVDLTIEAYYRVLE